MRHTTFQFTIDPDRSPVDQLRRHEGASRYAFNQCLRLHLNARRRRVFARAGVADQGDERQLAAEKRSQVPWTGFDLINAFNAWKKTAAAGRTFHVARDGAAEVEVTGLRWRREVCQQVFEEAAVDCGRALGAWTASRRRKRAGRKVGHPRFKRKADRSGSFRLRNKTGKSGRASIRVGDSDDVRSVSLPGVGTVRVFDDTRPLRRLLAKGRAKILFATVRVHPSGRWTISLNVQAENLHDSRRHADPAGPWVGVDRGLSALAVGGTSSGEEVLRIDAPRALTRGLPKQRRLAKAVSRKPKGSANRRKAIHRLARHHETVANRRKHFLHQVTNSLVKTHDRICLEDLNTAGMLYNPKLARHIADAAWATLAHQLAYKQAWARGELILADRWLASSKTCSTCGVIKPLQDLSERTFCCETCGAGLDRDLNAAINLAAWAESHARTPDRQADGRDINACREARSGRTPGCGETSLNEAGTDRQAIAA